MLSTRPAGVHAHPPSLRRLLQDADICELAICSGGSILQGPEGQSAKFLSLPSFPQGAKLPARNGAVHLFCILPKPLTPEIHPSIQMEPFFEKEIAFQTAGSVSLLYHLCCSKQPTTSLLDKQVCRRQEGSLLEIK